MEIHRHDPFDTFTKDAMIVAGIERLGQFGKTMIVGSNLYDTGKEDRRKRYPDALGVDMIEGDGVDLVANLEDRKIVHQIGPFNHIECISVLEHSRKPWIMAQNLKAMMLPGATILISVPFAWRRHAYPSDYWRFTIEGVKELFTGIMWAGAAYCHNGMLDYKGKIPSIDGENGKFIARTEAFLFGVRG